MRIGARGTGSYSYCNVKVQRIVIAETVGDFKSFLVVIGCRVLPRIQIRRGRASRAAPANTTGETMSIKSKLINFMDQSVTKAIFSISIIGSALPSIYQDVTSGRGMTWAYFGNVMIGILILLESWLWTADVVREQ